MRAKFVVPIRLLSPFPHPLWGRDNREGGNASGFRAHGTPTPNPSPQGGGELTAFAAMARE